LIPSTAPDHDRRIAYNNGSTMSPSGGHFAF